MAKWVVFSHFSRSASFPGGGRARGLPPASGDCRDRSFRSLLAGIEYMAVDGADFSRFATLRQLFLFCCITAQPILHYHQHCCWLGGSGSTVILIFKKQPLGQQDKAMRQHSISSTRCMHMGKQWSSPKSQTQTAPFSFLPGTFIVISNFICGTHGWRLQYNISWLGSAGVGYPRECEPPTYHIIIGCTLEFSGVPWLSWYRTVVAFRIGAHNKIGISS